MTKEEFNALQFRCTSHIAIDKSHILTYFCDEIKPPIRMEKYSHKGGKSERTYLWNGKTYKTATGLINAIKKSNEPFKRL